MKSRSHHSHRRQRGGFGLSVNLSDKDRARIAALKAAPGNLRRSISSSFGNLKDKMGAKYDVYKAKKASQKAYDNALYQQALASRRSSRVGGRRRRRSTKRSKRRSSHKRKSSRRRH